MSDQAGQFGFERLARCRAAAIGCVEVIRHHPCYRCAYGARTMRTGTRVIRVESSAVSGVHENNMDVLCRYMKGDRS